MSEKTSPVLHEIIAVESSKDQVVKNITEEAFVTFRKKTELFRGHSRSYSPIAESEHAKDEYAMADELTIVSETVPDKLDYVFAHLANYYDLVLQKDETNQRAKADLIVDGQTIATDLPATFLLAMESKLKTVRELILSVPTLTPNVAWVPDPDMGKNIFRTEKPVEKFKTKKIIEPQILVKADQFHPAQIEKLSRDVPVGRFTEQSWSSAITPARKAELLERTDNLILACKTARQRANSTAINKSLKVGQDLFNYITK